MRLESLFKEAGIAGRDGLPILSVSIHTGISDRELGDDEVERKVARSEDKSLYKQVLAGDLVYNQMRAWQGGFGVAKLHGMVSPAYVVARPNGRVNPFYMEYLLRSPSAIEEMRRRSRGIADFRLRLYWDKFKDIRVALPPLHEQNEIVERLDVTAGLIRSQMRAIEQLESLLAEQSKCLLRDAMTGSVDTNQKAVGLAQAA